MEGKSTIELIPSVVEQLISFRIEGKISARDIEYIAKIIEDKLKLYDKLRIYAEIKSIEGMSLTALIEDLRFSIRHLHDFEREAIVSDRNWLKQLANVSDRLFPSIAVKHFSWSEKDDALAWVVSDR